MSGSNLRNVALARPLPAGARDTSTLLKFHLDKDLKRVFSDKDGSIWVGFNVSRLPQRQNSTFRTLAEAMVPRFYNEQFPYICITLVPCALCGDFLDIFRRFEVIPFDGQYILLPFQADLWEIYKHYTFRLCQSLVQHITLPLYFALPILPCKIGYFARERTEAGMFSCARRVRRAFYLLFSMATYLIALVPDWKKIASDAGIPEEWLGGLEGSPITNFDIKEGQVGVFIDFSKSTAELRNLPRLIKRHIPFWILWDDRTTHRPQLKDSFELRIAELFRPSADKVRLAKEEACQMEAFFKIDMPDYSTPWDYDYRIPMATPGAESLDSSSSLPSRTINPEITTVTGARSRPTETNPPPIEPYSGYVFCEPGQVEKGSHQLPFESPEQFWARQNTENKKKLSNMPEAERKHLKTERDGYHITKKSNVFHWEKFPWGYVRRRVGRKDFDDYSKYPLTQMRFSVTRNEWDVCSDFGPDEEPSSLYPDSDDSCEFLKMQRSAKEVAHLQSFHEDRASDKQITISILDEEGEILESDHVSMHTNGLLSDEMVSITKRFQEAMKTRYAIRHEVKVRELEDVALDRMLYPRYGLLLRNVHSIAPLDKDGRVEAIAERAWVTTCGILYNAESSIKSFSLQEMLGITQFVRLLLENMPIPALVIDIHPDNFDSPVALDMRDLLHAFHIQKCVLDRAVYLLQPDDLGYVIALEEPSLVVEDLGYCTLDEEPGAYAYAQYKKLLQIFMRQPRSRSMFGLGGPVWCAITEVQVLDDVKTGPSEDISFFGHDFALSDGRTLWEDQLTESELLFLCGTYKVRKGNNVMLYSWWPTPRQWAAATSNVRYWSPGNECWFMTCLHNIRNGRATWIHAPQWPQKLKTNKKTKHLMEKNKASCEAFLERGE
ncbi:hypothetical protein ACEPAH_2907 [Sanghuangporus vaninii]